MVQDDNVQPIIALPVDKQTIIKNFRDNVVGKKADTAKANLKHSGKDGHWLELAMGLRHNGNNAPDILGYEMKNGTAAKTTFGDWSANYYIYKDTTNSMSRSEFLKIFGKPNALKGGRPSWSGEPCPKINGYNRFGQKLVIDQNNNIQAIYSYSEDKRVDKNSIVPAEMQHDKLVLAQWNATTLKVRVESKFNDKGWFKCEKNNEGIYISIAFGDPISFEQWIDAVKRGDVFFDSGMYEGNNRPYSQWRANNLFWENMVTSRHS